MPPQKQHESLLSCLAILLCWWNLTTPASAQSSRFPTGTAEVTIPTVAGVRSALLKNIAGIVQHSINDGAYPGAIILASHNGKMIYRGIFGNRRIKPDVAPMTFATVFDVASLTKVIATTPAIMQLVEAGKLDIDARVSTYWPAFASNGKEEVTVRELLTHTSGLPADIDLAPATGYTAGIARIEQCKLLNQPGSTLVYSDVNFIALAHLVELISGQPFAKYAQRNIFIPLKMHHTSFLPKPTLREHIAPTEQIEDKLRWGEVHDPMTYAMGGISGAAGVFSTASDLARYAQFLLASRISTRRPTTKTTPPILGPLTILKMTTPQTPPEIQEVRGLGWDLESRYSNRGALFPLNSFGHTGYTGTSIWIDPLSQTWIIILTNRVHPKPALNNQLPQDRRLIANIIAASITDVPTYHQINTSLAELKRAYFTR